MTDDKVAGFSYPCGGKMKDDEIRSTKERKGWLLPYLLKLDEIFFGRWEYWFNIIESDKILKGPIPQIPFKAAEEYTERLVQKNIRKCLDRGSREDSNSLGLFVDWIMWGLGKEEEFPRVSETLDDFWYRTFNLGLFYKEPADHWSMIAMESMGNGNGHGFFPTPASVVKMMTQMTFAGQSLEQQKRTSMMDPCCGTGIMFLYASNHTLNIQGNDISPLLVKMAKMNAFIYIPWLAYRPDSLKIFDRSVDNLQTINLSAQHSVENDGLGGLSVAEPDISKELLTEISKKERVK
ncbi:hypothetical protein E3V33_00160 [Candidatus Marinimicrobia bacterium MT.SAG.4]|nr:hypothetical protein E3V33_00160 [Candidatus Marinimicrobia bacterium MT.SAG.4]